MPLTPPASLIHLIHEQLAILLTYNPAATSSEAYVRHSIEQSVLTAKAQPHYYLRIGINYHGNKVQHLEQDDNTGHLIGWNPTGDALGTGAKAKVLLSGVTIHDRDPGEQNMSDTKIGGGDIPGGRYVRVEFKARGWLGQTKNLDGKQLEKDLDLLKKDQADLLVICLSETAHRKWRGEGPVHNAGVRTGIARFQQILPPVTDITGTQILQRNITFEGQEWATSTQRVVGGPTSIMPGAEHYVTLVWRRR